MLFNSIQFLIFFPVVVCIYFLLDHRWRWMWLLASSCYFYMAFIPIYILVLFFTIIVDYIAGILIEGAAGAARKRFLALSIVANVGTLSLFKYYNFLSANLAEAFRPFGLSIALPVLTMALPIGLSFHTFQAMSYTIEVYRGNQKAERHFGIYALYVMFFPQLVAGPIERPQNLLPQFRAIHRFDYVRVSDGLRRMTWGMFKKVAIADRLAPLVNMAYDCPSCATPAELVMATVFFAFQIYCDFSGYSDIALGAAEVLGFRLMENFTQPYFAQTMSEFWTRWHISLSSWFRDYVYIPLGGNRVSRRRWVANILIVFCLSGLWHGANWTFVVWGALNGIYVVAGELSKRNSQRLPALAYGRIAVTFSLTCAAWVFFRARTMTDALAVLQRLPRGFLELQTLPSTVGRLNVLIAVGLIALLLAVDLFATRIALWRAIALRPVWVRWPVYYAGIMATVLWGNFAGSQPFIYFQF